MAKKKDSEERMRCSFPGVTVSIPKMLVDDAKIILFAPKAAYGHDMVTNGHWMLWGSALTQSLLSAVFRHCKAVGHQGGWRWRRQGRGLGPAPAANYMAVVPGDGPVYKLRTERFEGKIANEGAGIEAVLQPDTDTEYVKTGDKVTQTNVTTGTTHIKNISLQLPYVLAFAALGARPYITGFQTDTDPVLLVDNQQMVVGVCMPTWPWTRWTLPCRRSTELSRMADCNLAGGQRL